MFIGICVHDLPYGFSWVTPYRNPWATKTRVHIMPLYHANSFIAGMPVLGGAFCVSEDGR